MLDHDLLAILACPKCKGSVEIDKEKTGLLCSACRLLYEIRNDVPIMLIDQAKKVD